MQKVENHCSEPRWGSSLFSGSNGVGKDPSVHCTGLKLFSGYPLAGIKNSEARGGVKMNYRVRMELTDGVPIMSWDKVSSAGASCRK